MNEGNWKARAERLEAALQEASELIHDLIDSGDGEVARVQRLVRTALAQPEPEQTMVPRCRCCGYLVTESEHRGCLRTPQPEPTDEWAEAVNGKYSTECPVCGEGVNLLNTIGYHMAFIHDGCLIERQPAQGEADEESGDE